MTTPAQIIKKKRDGGELSSEEIQIFIDGLKKQTFEDYQASALLMAICLRGMSLHETVELTRAMTLSGKTYDLKSIPGSKIDKHSTGGVGDKVSLLLAPLAAACGLVVPMMSGRGLGHTGGTLDKLESIPGFRTDLSESEFKSVLAKVGCAMIGQSQEVAPADQKLYALRDVTGTVECVPLIVSSILSKKLSEGTDGLVMDIKCGNGAFMKNRAQARQVARQLKLVGKKLGLKIHALMTSMDQPLGYAAGNTLEVIETIELLRGEKSRFQDVTSQDLKELTIQLCAIMLQLGGIVRNVTEGRKLAFLKLGDGSAYQKFRDLVSAQGGDISAVENPDRLELAPKQVVWKAKRQGFLSEIQTENLGYILVELGGGRRRKSDPIDPSVGLVFHQKLGAKVSQGDGIATVFASSQTSSETLARLEKTFQSSIKITSSRKPVPKLILDPNVK